MTRRLDATEGLQRVAPRDGWEMWRVSPTGSRAATGSSRRRACASRRRPAPCSSRPPGSTPAPAPRSTSRWAAASSSPSRSGGPSTRPSTVDGVVVEPVGGTSTPTYAMPGRHERAHRHGRRPVAVVAPRPGRRGARAWPSSPCPSAGATPGWVGDEPARGHPRAARRGALRRGRAVRRVNLAGRRPGRRRRAVPPRPSSTWPRSSRSTSTSSPPRASRRRPSSAAPCRRARPRSAPGAELTGIPGVPDVAIPATRHRGIRPGRAAARRARPRRRSSRRPRGATRAARRVDARGGSGDGAAPRDRARAAHRRGRARAGGHRHAGVAARDAQDLRGLVSAPCARRRAPTCGSSPAARVRAARSAWCSPTPARTRSPPTSPCTAPPARSATRPSRPWPRAAGSACCSTPASVRSSTPRCTCAPTVAVSTPRSPTPGSPAARRSAPRRRRPPRRPRPSTSSRPPSSAPDPRRCASPCRGSRAPSSRSPCSRPTGSCPSTGESVLSVGAGCGRRARPRRGAGRHGMPSSSGPTSRSSRRCSAGSGRGTVPGEIAWSVAGTGLRRVGGAAFAAHARR